MAPGVHRAEIQPDAAAAGDLKVTLVAMIFSVPISLARGRLPAEFARKWTREVFKPIVELLAGFPSVVLILCSDRYGFLASGSVRFRL